MSHAVSFLVMSSCAGQGSPAQCGSDTERRTGACSGDSDPTGTCSSDQSAWSLLWRYCFWLQGVRQCGVRSGGWNTWPELQVQVLEATLLLHVSSLRFSFPSLALFEGRNSEEEEEVLLFSSSLFNAVQFNACRSHL